MRSLREVNSTRRKVLSTSCVLGAASFVGLPGIAATDPPPEIKRIRLLKVTAICTAPQYVAEEMLRLEGFSDVESVAISESDNIRYVTAKRADVTTQDAPSLVAGLDAGDPIIVLAGIHAGCWELFVSNRVRSISELKGKTVAVSGIGQFDHRFLSGVLAYVGIDARKEIQWLEGGNATEAMSLFAQGKADGFFAFPPHPQELRLRKIGHVILNTTQDRPWSQYFCCMVTVHRDFVKSYPVATKRVVRAFLKAADLCAQEPERVAQFIVDKGYETRYQVALDVLKSLPYRRWREAAPEDTLRFYALRLHEVGIIKSDPKKLLSQGTDWRFLNELKRELKA